MTTAIVTIIDKFYFQTGSDEPLLLEPRPVSKVIDTDEQPYIRTLKLTKTPTKLDLGWINRDTGCSYLIIENHAGEDLQVIPTEEERKKLKSSWLYIGQNQAADYSFTPFLCIPPGESVRFCPILPFDLLIKIDTNGVDSFKATITAIPGYN